MSWDKGKGITDHRGSKFVQHTDSTKTGTGTKARIFGTKRVYITGGYTTIS